MYGLSAYIHKSDYLTSPRAVTMGVQAQSANILFWCDNTERQQHEIIIDRHLSLTHELKLFPCFLLDSQLLKHDSRVNATCYYFIDFIVMWVKISKNPTFNEIYFVPLYQLGPYDRIGMNSFLVSIVQSHLVTATLT